MFFNESFRFPKKSGMFLALFLLNFVLAQQHPLVQDTLVVLYKSLDYQEDIHYQPLIDALQPFGRVLLSGTVSDYQDKQLIIVAVGSSSYAAQQEIYQQRNKNVIQFVSLGFPIHFPLDEFGVKVSAVAPLIDVTTRSLFTFAIENYHYKRLTKNINNFIVANTEFADFFRDGQLIQNVVEGLSSKDAAITDSHPVNLISQMLQRESHQGLLPPCSYYSDADPWHVPQNVECKVGNQFMAGIQLQSGIGHVAKYFSRNLKTFGKTEGLMFRGKVQGLSNEVEVLEMEEHHYAWVHFPLHVPFAVNGTNFVNISSVSEVLYDNTVYGLEPFHPSLRQNQGDFVPRKLNVKWPLEPLSAYEMRGKLTSRQNIMEQLKHPFTDFDQLDNKLGLPFCNGQAVTERFGEKSEQEFDSLWQNCDVRDKHLGYCARLNLIAIRDAFRSLKFKGVRFVRKSDHVYVEPIMLDNYDNAALKQVHEKLHSASRMAVGGDIKTFASIGPLWIWRPFKVTEVGVAKVYQAPSLYTRTSFPIKDAAGLHFCKILPPSRVIEVLLYE